MNTLPLNERKQLNGPRKKERGFRLTISLNSEAAYGWSHDCAEADTSSPASEACYGGSENVGVVAVVVPELRLSDVQRQVLGRNLVIAANDAALEQAPEALNRVRVDRANNVLLGAVLDGAMREI